MGETIRERLARILEEHGHPLSADDLAAMLGLDPRTGVREVYTHLLHVARSVWRRSGGRKKLYMEPPRCRSCGFVFKNLEKPRKPSKCPRCSSQRIAPPRFIIMEA